MISIPQPQSNQPNYSKQTSIELEVNQFREHFLSPSINSKGDMFVSFSAS